MAPERFDLDFARFTAASDLLPEHVTNFQRLVKTLRHGPRHQLLFLEFNNVPYRDGLIARLNPLLERPTTLVLDATKYASFDQVERSLRELAASFGAIHVLGGEAWFDGARIETFNIRREAVIGTTPVPVLLWLTESATGQFARRAEDLWAWRAGVYSFLVHTESRREWSPPVVGPIDSRTLSERTRRIAELKAYLCSSPPPPEDLRLPLLDELAELHRSLGQLDEALRIRREEELPVYERLGDVQALLVARANLALILLKRGSASERAEAAKLLDLALSAAERLRIPEAEQIRSIQRQAGLATAE